MENTTTTTTTIEASEPTHQPQHRAPRWRPGPGDWSQRRTLALLVEQRVEVECVTGRSILGKLIEHDQYTITLYSAGERLLVYKAAIVSIRGINR